MNILLLSAVLLGGTGLILGVLIGIIANLFKVEVDHRVDLVIELLPGANCGGCGFAGCADFAKAVVENKVSPSMCPVASSEQISSIARAVGVDPGSEFKQVAVILCGGDRVNTMRLSSYHGVADCNSAMLVAGGPKGCNYGCLGFGSCANKCPFGAIEMINGLAVVHKELCVGCGTCLSSCPRNVIKLVPADAIVHVYCNSVDTAANKRKVCTVSCFGCRKCVRELSDKFTMEGFLATVNYETSPLPNEDDVKIAGCPTGALCSTSDHLRKRTIGVKNE